jgi:hypothetical protein
MEHLPPPVLGTSDDRPPAGHKEASPGRVDGGASGEAPVMNLMLALAEVQYDRRRRLPARLPATRLAVLERALRAELLRRGLAFSGRPSVATTRVTMRMA